MQSDFSVVDISDFSWKRSHTKRTLLCNTDSNPQIWYDDWQHSWGSKILKKNRLSKISISQQFRKMFHEKIKERLNVHVRYGAEIFAETPPIHFTFWNTHEFFYPFKINLSVFSLLDSRMYITDMCHCPHALITFISAPLSLISLCTMISASSVIILSISPIRTLASDWLLSSVLASHWLRSGSECWDLRARITPRQCGLSSPCTIVRWWGEHQPEENIWDLGNYL